MAQTAQTADSEQAGEAAAGVADAPRGLLARKRLLLLIAAATVFSLLGAAGGAWYFGLFGQHPDAASGAEAAHAAAGEAGAAPVAMPPPPVYYELPDFLVSLNTGERRSTFLKLRVSLELGSEADRVRIEQLLPRIADYCQVYLRELRLEDLRGSAGTLRLREELLRRIATAAAPAQVQDLLFSELFIQ